MDKNVIVIGGGIVGLSTAMQLTQRFPGVAVTVLEKEDHVSAHQTGHNSGVVHAGVYYQPESLKAQFCRAGVDSTLAFCRANDIPIDQCGKLIVASDDLGVSRLDTLFDRCRNNGLSPEKLDGRELQRREPRVVGKGAIFVAASGITDYPAIARTMASKITTAGGRVLTGKQVSAIRESDADVVVEAGGDVFRGDCAVVAGGLQADVLAAMCGLELDFRVIPFRGEYYRLPKAKNDIVKHLIYPVPDPTLPFLGVHLTRMIGGYVTVGPNAVLALAREGYSWSQINLRDLAGFAAFPGFWRMLRQHNRSAVKEMRNSLSRRSYLAECKKYCPELVLEDLQPHPSGVRAQAVLGDGTLVHDFLIRTTKRTLHVCNAPSPAATSALPIGRYLTDRCDEVFGLGRAAR